MKTLSVLGFALLALLVRAIVVSERKRVGDHSARAALGLSAV
jgi:hypothetical protein